MLTQLVIGHAILAGIFVTGGVFLFVGMALEWLDNELHDLFGGNGQDDT